MAKRDKESNPTVAEQNTLRDWLVARGFKVSDLKDKQGGAIIRAGRKRREISNDLIVLLQGLPRKQG